MIANERLHHEGAVAEKFLQAPSEEPFTVRPRRFATASYFALGCSRSLVTLSAGTTVSRRGKWKL